MSQLLLLGSAVLRPRNLFATALGMLLTPAFLAASPCVQPDAGGTVTLPPVGCPYVSPTDFHIIVNGLPAGTTIKVGVEHARFINITNVPGGALGGEIEQFQSDLHLTLTGTGGLTGFSRTMGMPAQCVTHTAPRLPGASPQSFDTDMFGIQGQLPPGDPDFDLLRITAGSGFGMPSPGHTTLTQLPGGNWNVDSFFDIEYRIDFVGHTPGPLAGKSGSTTATIRMGTGEPVPLPPCTVVDNGTGTVDLPPQGCGYVSPSDLHKMIDGLPPGTKINVAAQHMDFFNVTRTPDALGGETEHFSSGLLLKLDGTHDLAGFHRTLNMQAQCEVHTGPRIPGTSPQSFDTDMRMIQGQLPIGDPDFDLLRITGGTSFGMPSPGHTTLTRPPGQVNWNLDSFFDIEYRIDFIGAPGGQLAGKSGSTTATIRMRAGNPGTVGVPELEPQGPLSLKLANQPNPFNSGTSIGYRLSQSANIHLAVYDAAGKLVRNLTNAILPAGPHAMFWDARNDAGRKLGAGTYFIKISINGKPAGSTKATIIK
jgi:hypothetical protein